MDSSTQTDSVTVSIPTDQVDSRSRSNKIKYTDTIQKYRKIAKEIILILFILFMIYSSLKGDQASTEVKLNQISKLLESDLSILALSAEVPRTQRLAQDITNFKNFRKPEWTTLSTMSPTPSSTSN